jgi:cobyrinic acid a,c-diamide synthase
MLSRETNMKIFARATQDADIAVIEGVMGLFDGKSSPSLSGASAEMAIWLDAAVVLVLDTAAMAGSAGLLHMIGHEPLLDLGMHLGEGTGAALAMSLIRASIEAFTGMATFQSAGVSNK